MSSSNSLGVQTGAFTNQTANSVAAAISAAGLAATTGNVYYCNPVSGNDNFTGQSPATAVQSLPIGYGLLSSGNNDVLVIIGNGLSSASARIHNTFTWSKNAAHLVGVCAPSRFSQRARIAPGTTDTAFANFFVVSGNGCLFSNVQWFQGFATGIAAEICITVSGSRNVFNNCHIAGMGDTSSTHGAASTTSRNLVISGGENYFVNSVIGLDTVARSVANASVEFKAGAARNGFKGCQFVAQATIATAIGIYTAGAATLDRTTLLEDCSILNAVNSGGTAMNSWIQIAASSGGNIVMKNCIFVGVTKLVDSTSSTQCWAYGQLAATTAYLSDNPGS